MSGRDALKLLHAYGVKVTKRPDGSLGLMPPELVTPDIVQLARDAKPEIEAVVRYLPSPNCCVICGDPVDADGKSQTHCVDCGLLAAERLGLTYSTAAHDIAQEGISDAA